MSIKVIKNAKLILENNIVNGELTIENGKISKISNETFETANTDNINNDNVIDLNGNYLAPGFIDIHFHGGNGFDFLDSTHEAFSKILEFKARNGVTSVLPTLMTAPKEKLIDTLKNIAKFCEEKRDSKCNILGIDMEGPFFNVNYRGAQNEKFISEIDVEIVKEFLSIKKDFIKLFCLSPEKNNAIELIKFLNENKIISSVAHSGAAYEQMQEAFKSGLTHSTHTFNGMSGIKHQEIGVAGSVLLNDDIYAELIIDGKHFRPELAGIILKCKSIDKIIAITDAMRAAGMKDGFYELGGKKVKVSNNEARLVENNALAGSVLTMDKALKNIIDFFYLNIVDAIKLVSSNAARELNLKKGFIKNGYDADFVVLDKNLNVLKTIVSGNIVYENNL